ncbi:MAG: hypothetical protein SA378_05310 [Sedimentibacter sp.]|uniref:hypothetical protein n=1 Tax=Sedimentibacter sp. TaxID=1960295 RepID=UPI0029813541|nr:hypothetical protein [Sedimentibacter sp.]MDW5299540.1 hypothetical protein [Sedimentibacter sp.]
MGRFTKRLGKEVLIKMEDGGQYSPCYGCQSEKECMETRCNFYYAIEKLAEYEDKEEEEIK